MNEATAAAKRTPSGTSRDRNPRERIPVLRCQDSVSLVRVTRDGAARSTFQVMTRCVECLSCGLQRIVSDDAGECSRCGYLGWAPIEAVSEELRRSLRDIPVEARRPCACGRRCSAFRAEV